MTGISKKFNVALWIAALSAGVGCERIVSITTPQTPTFHLTLPEGPTPNILTPSGSNFLWGVTYYESESAIKNTLQVKYVKRKFGLKKFTRDFITFSSKECIPSATNCSNSVDIDAEVAKFKNNGWSMVPNFNIFPDTASDLDNYAESYVNFIDWFLTRYKTDANIKYIELENAPCIISVTEGKEGSLLNMMNKTYDRIKVKFPDVAIGTIGFEVWNDTDRATDAQTNRCLAHMEYFLNPSNGAKFDFLALHGYLAKQKSGSTIVNYPPTYRAIYNKFADILGINEIRKIMDANGWQDRLIFDVETNFPLKPATAQQIDLTDAQDKLAAAVFIQSLVLKLALKTDYGSPALHGALLFYILHRSTLGDFTLGSLTSSGTETQQIKTAGHLISKLNGLEHISHLSGEYSTSQIDNANIPWVEKFTSGNKELYVFFKPFKYTNPNPEFDNQTVSYSLTLPSMPASVVQTDINGNSTMLPTGSSLMLQATNQPQYLEVTY